jgi:hypothetical protein
VTQAESSIRQISEAVDIIAKFARDMDEKNAQRNARLDALEASTQQLAAEIAALRSPIHIEQSEDLRAFTVVQGDSRTSFTLPVLLYRAGYQSGVSYEQGDVVTHSGSAWHWRSTRRTPGTEDWQLMVKKGKDAKGDL